MSKGPIRRAQLIAPFGVGSMVVVRDGTSLISCGLDHWFQREDGQNDSQTVDYEEYKIEEWRLQKMLAVDHFRLPPDYRNRIRGESAPNTTLTVPFLRFPQWHFCPFCKRLEAQPLLLKGKAKCRECETKGKKNIMVQVPFVAICDHGHIQDFPWREWVHKSAQPECNLPMRLIATGGASLAAQKVVCDCGKERNLTSITNASPDGKETFLSKNLEGGDIPFLCKGQRPWVGDTAGEGCSQPLRGSLRSASNVYFAHIYSAIYLPRGNSSIPPELIAVLEQPPLSTFIKTVLDLGGRDKINAELLRGNQRELLQPYSDPVINSAVKLILNGESSGDTSAQGESTDSQEVAFRRAEYDVLTKQQNTDELLITSQDVKRYGWRVPDYFSSVMLIDKLRETRALAGFSRIFPENDLKLEHRKSKLWKQPPAGDKSWLPAYIVYGEGIFLTLNEKRLQKWENSDAVQSRIAGLASRYQTLQQDRKLRDISIEPRFVLLHTLAHVLMNQLTFDCGYSSASLRERLFVSSNKNSPMAGILIYTAAGDSEGTMGGLVRMGKPGYLEPVITKALDDAKWCSADPVCMEMGSHNGQGPDSCNLAACHNCGLVPETACEHFNRFLDRALLIGDLGNLEAGYFTFSG